MSLSERERLLSEANRRHRDLTAKLVETFGAEDVAAMLLVRAIAVQGLDRNKDECAQWLRALAVEIESAGTVANIDPKTLN